MKRKKKKRKKTRKARTEGGEVQIIKQMLYRTLVESVQMATNMMLRAMIAWI